MSEQQPGESGDRSSGQVSGFFVQVPAETNESILDVRRIWQILLGSKILILSIAATATVIALIVALIMTPVYRSQILLAPASTEDEKGQLAALIGQYAPGTQFGGLSSGSSNKDQAIAVLQSRQFTEQFIESENLMPVLFSELWDAQNGKWAVDNSGDVPTMSQAVAKFSDSIRKVHEDGRRNLVALQIDWTDPELAARWANKLVSRLNDYLRQRDIAEAQRSIEFLNQELEKSSVIELRQGVYRLIESQIEMVMLANVRDEYAFKILDPAVPSEPNQFIRPKRPMIVIVGFMFGLMLGASFALIRADWSK